MTIKSDKLKVLILEDLEDDAILMVAALRRGGFDPDWRRVETKTAFRAALEEGDWEVILSDYRLPTFNGAEALACLKPLGIDLPFIVISGAIGEEVAVDLMREGAADFMLKESLVRLPEVVRRSLEDKANRDGRRQAEDETREARERLEHLNILLRSIRDMNQLIVREKNRDALIDAACQTLVRSRGLLGAWILLEESDAGTWTQAQSGLPDTAYQLAVAELEKGVFPSCYRKVEAMAGEVLILRPGQECERCPLSTCGHVGVSLVVNLIHESQRFGVLCVSVPESYAEDETEQELLREIANDLAMALYGIEMESRRRAAEESLRGERQRMQMIIEGGGLGTWVWNLHTNETFLNEQWAHSLGYTLEELSPTTYETWVEVVHPEDLPLVQERLDLCLAGENPEYECELRLRHKQGHWIWILDRGRVLERDAEGKPETMFGTHTDITEIKNAEAELVQTKHLLTESQRVAGIGSWQWDLASDTTLWSEGMYAVFGLEKSTVARVDVRDLIHPDYVEWCNTYFQERITHADSPFEFDYPIVRPNGETAWIHNEAEVQRDPRGKALRMIGISQDITAEREISKKLAESERRLRTAQTIACLGTWTLDLENGEVVWSEELYRMFGLAVEEDVPSLSQQQEIMTAASWEKLTAAIERTRSAGIPYELELEICRSDGNRGWLWARGEAKRDSNGEIRMLQGVAQDITERKQTEMRVVESERMLQKAQTIANMGSWTMTLETQEVSWSPQLYRMFGFDPELDLPPFSEHAHLFTPESWEHLRAAVARTIETGQPYSFEVEYIRKDGSHAWAWVQGEAVEDPSENRVGLRGVAQDIAERKAAETELREAHDRLEVAISGGGLGTWEWEPVLPEDESSLSGPMVVNDRWVTMLGYQPGELAPTLDAAIALTDPECLPYLRKQILAHFEGEIPYYQAVYRMRHRSGDWVWIQSRGQITERKFDGSPAKVCGIHVNVTPLMRAEQELRESEARLRSYLERAPLGIFIKNKQNAYLEVNPATSKITGYTRGELLQMNSRELLCDKAGKRIEPKKPEDGQHEMYFTRKDGVRRLAMVTYVQLDEELTLGFVQDFTESRKLQEQMQEAQRLDAVGQLAGGVAHDFNNLLQGVMGYTELCRDELGEQHPSRHWLDEILKQTERSAGIIRQLLAFSRKQTISPKILNINETVESMLKMLRRLIGEDIELSWQPGANLLPVKMDPGQVDQILANLCVNARDAIGGVGTITLETSVEMLDAEYCATHPDLVPGPYLMLAVSDNGCGMDAETQNNIFEPFFTTKEKGKGTGLGLATVYGIVKQNSGSISVYSEPEKGSTFRVYLPGIQDATPDLQPQTRPKPPCGKGETLLLVEDEEAIRVTLSLFLRDLGYEVLDAGHPEQALQIMASRPQGVEALITDVVMPGMNGRDLAEKLRDHYPKLKVLFMSGYTGDVIANRGVLESGVEFLPKPIMRHVLAKKIHELLN